MECENRKCVNEHRFEQIENDLRELREKNSTDHKEFYNRIESTEKSMVESVSDRKHINEKLDKIDVNVEALKMARTNGQRLHVEDRAQWLCGDLFEKVTGAFDLIVSNPPYIRSAEIEELQEEVRLYDPRIALDGAEDGLLFYRRIIEESKSYLKNGGRLLFEIGCDQGRDVAELLENAGYTEVSVKKDLAGLDRVAAGRLQ